MFWVYRDPNLAFEPSYIFSIFFIFIFHCYFLKQRWCFKYESTVLSQPVMQVIVKNICIRKTIKTGKVNILREKMVLEKMPM